MRIDQRSTYMPLTAKKNIVGVWIYIQNEWSNAKKVWRPKWNEEEMKIELEKLKENLIIDFWSFFKDGQK